MEFWPSNYGIGANGVFDHDDDGFDATSGYGSMQIHNVSVPQTLLAFNAWGAGPSLDVGIGNNPGGDGAPDWTFSGSSSEYTVRNLQILVQPIPEPSSVALVVAALAGGAAWHAARRRRYRVQ